MKSSPLIIVLSVFAAVTAHAGGKVIAPVSESKAPITDAKALIAEPTAPCLSYDYVDLEYLTTGSEGIFGGGDGYSASFSKSLGELFFLTGGYTNAGADYIDNNVAFDFESHRYQLGLGARFALTECVHLTLEGGAEHADNRFGNTAFNYDSWAYYIGPGLRARAGRFEFFGEVFYVGREGVPGNGFAYENDTWVFNPGVLFHLNDRLALKVAGSFTEDTSLFTFGARINF
ncbi:MAG: hypothetical protein AAGF67_04550 [Verrucomicrobiota bacterium]